MCVWICVCVCSITWAFPKRARGLWGFCCISSSKAFKASSTLPWNRNTQVWRFWSFCSVDILNKKTFIFTFFRSFSAASISALMVLSNLFNSFGFFFFAVREDDRGKAQENETKRMRWNILFLPFSFSLSSVCFSVISVTQKHTPTCVIQIFCVSVCV